MDIATIFPEINEIKEDSLRDKTEQALKKAIQLGGWSMDQLSSIPFTLLIPELMDSTEKPKISIIEHLRAVTQLCMSTYDRYAEFGLGEKLNRDEIISAGLLHDVGKFVEYKVNAKGKIVQTESGKYIRHPAQGLEIVAEFDLPLSVRQAIVFHSKEGDKINRLPEVEIVHRCDFLCFAPLKKIFEEN
ncbi:MAG: HD domain-containing protein [Candidatus Kariarchaeaceae archaeon]|jgi:putative nucleotidyltransferase with HDIG domain